VETEAQDKKGLAKVTQRVSGKVGA